MAGDIQDYIQGLQLLGGMLALPRSTQYAQESAEAHRRMLEGTGLDPADVQAMYPDAPLGFLRAGGPGVGSKILGGVGDVGTILSTIAGKPIGPPRLNVSEIANASKLRKAYREQGQEAELQRVLSDPNSTQEQIRAAFAGTGNVDALGRIYSAQLRGTQTPPWRGTPGERTTLTDEAQRTARANQRDALVAAGNDPHAVDRWIATGGTLAPPKEDPAITAGKQRDALIAKRQAEWDTMGKPRSGDDYQRYVYGTAAAPPRQAARRERTLEDYRDDAWKAEVARAGKDFDDPDPAKAEANAQAAFRLTHPQPGGAPPGGAPPASPPSPAGPPSEAFDVPIPLREQAALAGPQGSPEAAAFGGSTPPTSPTPPTPTAPPSSPLGNTAVPPPDQWTPEQRAAVDAIRKSDLPLPMKQAQTIGVFKK